MATNDAPVVVGHVALIVRDLDKLGDFYRSVVGLEELSADRGTIRLGAGGRVLLELRGDKAARRSRGGSGLNHTAFLVPGRGDLGAFLRHFTALGHRLGAAEDHGASDSLYFSDPEGNGIEVTADTPRELWPRRNGRIAMYARGLDLRAVADDAAGVWRGAPEQTVVGHVHMQVGGIEAATDFITGPLNMEIVQGDGGSMFYASGGYHHHLAVNAWGVNNSPRPEGEAGLASVTLQLDPALYDAAAQKDLRDPWGTRFVLERKPG